MYCFLRGMMVFEIVPRYAELKKNLVERILTETINVYKITSDDFECYFCRKGIRGRTYLLIDEVGKLVQRFPLDEACYKNILLQKN